VTRARETVATVAWLHAENATLRQRVAELERLVGQLKRRLWPTR
jgi:cell division protein FtsB